MAVHKLTFEDAYNDAIYTLIAIHCSIEDYRLAYILNKNLNITLKRKPFDLDYNSDVSSYVIFEWEDSKELTLWSLVSNVSKIQTYYQPKNKTLFDTQEITTKTTYLIPEYKSVNYFLKIDNQLNDNHLKSILNTIIKIPQIITAFSVNVKQLKSKDNLIFS